MKKQFVRAVVTACLLGSAAVITPMASLSPAVAASGPSVSAPVGKILVNAQKAYQANDFAGGLTLTKQAQALPDRSDFDNYEINKMLAFGLIKTNDLPGAYDAELAMAASPSLPDTDKVETFRIVTLLAAQLKHYDVAIKYGTQFETLSPTPDPLVLGVLAQSYYYSNDFANAEALSAKSIAATPAGKAPDRGALEVVFASQIKQNKMADANNTLEEIVTWYDEPDEWAQLILSSISVKGIKDYEALDIFRLMVPTKAKGSADDYTTPASVALGANLPVEAESFLKAGIDAGKLTSGNALYAKAHTAAARDRATIGQFDAEARKSPNGELDARLADTYYGYGRYDDAIAAAQRALKKGGPKVAPDQMNMIIAMSLTVQGKTADATAAFNTVSGSTAALAKAKHLWLLYLNRKTATASAAPAPAQ
jgi:tetratricopeptide (TPR) repeat protein